MLCICSLLAGSLCWSIATALLCGLNGYTVFLDERQIEKIASWQNRTTGCYEYHGHDETDNYVNDTMTTMTTASASASEPARVAPMNQYGGTVRDKRSVIRLNDMCSDHMTGLAVAAFGLLANVAAFA